MAEGTTARPSDKQAVGIPNDDRLGQAALGARLALKAPACLPRSFQAVPPHPHT